MITITPPSVRELDLVVGYRLTCSSCERALFIESGTSLSAVIERAGWREAITTDSHFPCVCPKCIDELRHIEAERKGGIIHA